MMKRISGEDGSFEGENLMKKVNLVERNPTPCGVSLVSADRVGKCDSSDIMSLVQEIANADQALKNRATGKLSVILEQIRFLQQQAAKIIKETQDSKDLHGVACNFQKVPGKTYHLYKRESGQRYLSMISPNEWSEGFTHEYLGGFRLELDHSWTSQDLTADVDTKRLWSERLLEQGASHVLAIQDE